jgi:tetratricopeptide (TPR) repeat protein
MNYKLMISLLVVFSQITSIWAQTPKAFEAAADKAFEAKDYFTSLKYLESAMEQEPDNIALLYKHAEAARMFESYLLAERSYERVLAMQPDQTIKAAFYGLAAVEQNLGKYDEAVKHYEEYLLKNENDPELIKATSKGIEDCDWALEQINRPFAGVLLERLGTGINTANSEFNPVRVGETLYFSSFRDDKWKDKHYPTRPIIKIMESPDRISSIATPWNATDKHTAHTAFSPDGKFLVSNFCNYKGETDVVCNLYIRTKSGENWSEPVALPASINYADATSTQPSVAANPDGTYTLFYVSDRAGGKGKLDIWKAVFDGTGTFSAPENLANINTEADDVTPFYHEEGKALYFSTKGRRTLGGFDIYQSKYSTDLGWLAPEHLEVPFNTSYNDLYFFLQGHQAWFSSNRTGSIKVTEESCCYDIYQATYLDLGLDVFAFSKVSNLPLDNVIFTLIEKPSAVDPTSRFSADKNTTNFNVSAQKQYYVIASKDGYRPDTIDIVTDIIPDSRRFAGNLYLEPQDLDLAVYTFTGHSKDPLKGVSIRLLEMRDQDAEVKKLNTQETNTTDLKVKMQTPYMIIADKSGYSSDTTLLDASELRFGEKTVKKLYLDPGDMRPLLPLMVYFDNDHPDPRTRLTETTKSYEDTYTQYFAKKEAYASGYASGFTGEEKLLAQERVRLFFDNDVKGGMANLQNFADNLDLFLTNGYKVEIIIKGFASPLAKDDYNMSLTRRRVVCVTNYLRKVRGGIYDEYLRSGALAVNLAPFGEQTAPSGISDSGKDRKRSVFSPEASKERRAEVLEVRLIPGGKN